MLSDDVFRKRLLRASRNESRSQEAGGSGPSGASDSVKNDGAKNSSKSGKGSKSSGSGRKSEKRGASASPSERAAKKRFRFALEHDFIPFVLIKPQLDF